MFTNIRKFINNSFLMDNIDNIAFFVLLSILFCALFTGSGILGGLALVFCALIIFKTIIKTPADFNILNCDYKKTLFIYFLLVTLSLFASSLFNLSLHGYIKTLIYIIFFYSCANFFKANKNKITFVIIFITILASFESFIAIFQNYSGVSAISGWQDMTNINPEQVIARAYGTLKPYNPNLLAGYLLCALSCLVYAVFYFINSQKKKTALIFSVLFLINFIAIIDTGCRGAYLGFALFFPCLFLSLIYFVNKKSGGLSNIKKRYKNLCAIAFVTILGFILTNPAITKRFQSIFALRADSSISFRLNVYESVWNMFLDNPFLGIGVGNQNFREIYGLYMKTGYDALGSYCVPLEIAVESGVFALLAFVLFLIFVIKKCFNIIKSPDFSNRYKILAFSIILMILAVSGHGLFDTIWFRPQVQFLFWTLIAMLDGVKSIKLTKAM